MSRLYEINKLINAEPVILCTNIKIQTYIQWWCGVVITHAQEIYITNFPVQNRLRDYIV